MCTYYTRLWWLLFCWVSFWWTSICNNSTSQRQDVKLHAGTPGSQRGTIALFRMTPNRKTINKTVLWTVTLGRITNKNEQCFIIHYDCCSAEYHSDECHGATKYFKLISSYSWGLYYTTFYSRKSFIIQAPGVKTFIRMTLGRKTVVKLWHNRSVNRQSN